MKLLVGLGNPGREYQHTRHNIGFMFVDELAKQLNLRFSMSRSLKCEMADFNYRGEKIIIIKPQTYMNLSGEAVIAVSRFYQIDTDDIFVIYDDLDLPLGKVRIRRSGSSGGHKGMKNIIELLNTDQIKRIRIGIGNHEETDACDYVLGRISEKDFPEVADVMIKAREMLEYMMGHTFEDFMGHYN
jgi:PTH1 family peptidyl-tRNA hydrolase